MIHYGLQSSLCRGVGADATVAMVTLTVCQYPSLTVMAVSQRSLSSVRRLLRLKRNRRRASLIWREK